MTYMLLLNCALKLVEEIILDMFRALTCPSSGGQIILSQNLVSSLCKRLYSMPDDCSLLSSGILYSRLQRVTIPDAVITQFLDHLNTYSFVKKDSLG